MFRRNGPAPPPWIVAIAVGGVLVGHGLTYVVLQPDGHARAGLLARTGHAFIHLVDGPALLLALAAASWLFLSRVTRRVGEPGTPATFAGLATFQVTAFVAMEVVERLAAGAPLADLLGGLMAIGVASQLLVAAALVWTLRRLPDLAARAAAAITTSIAPLPRPALVSVPSAILTPGRSPDRRADPIRGPPPLPA